MSIIDFSCDCGQRIQVPDSMAGKQGRCPACNQVLVITPPEGQDAPGEQDLEVPPEAPRIPSEPSASTDRSQDATRACPACAEVIQAAARRCRHCGHWIHSSAEARSPGQDLRAEEGYERTGPPWEDPQQTNPISAMSRTLTGIITRPTESFAEMRIRGGIGKPFLYTFIIGFLSGLTAFLFQTAFQFVAHGPGGVGPAQGAIPGLDHLGGLLLLFGVFGTAAGAAIGPFLYAGLLHLALMVVGGAHEGFEATFRVVAYGPGTTNLFQAIPFAGGLLSGIWGLILVGIGLPNTHRCTSGQAIGAIGVAIAFVFVSACGCGIVFALAIGSAGSL